MAHQLRLYPHPMAQTPLSPPMRSRLTGQHLVAVSPLCPKATCLKAPTAASLPMQTVSQLTNVASSGISLGLAGMLPLLSLLGKGKLQASLLNPAGVHLCLQTIKLLLQRQPKPLLKLPSRRKLLLLHWMPAQCCRGLTTRVKPDLWHPC